jgi:hypothetical protein
MGPIFFFIALFLLMIFMRSMDERFGNFMGMIVVLGIVGFAIIAVTVIAGVVIIPILFAIAAPVFIFWFVYWFLKQLFESSEQQLRKTNVRNKAMGLKPKSDHKSPGSRPGLHNTLL